MEFEEASLDTLPHIIVDPPWLEWARRPKPAKAKEPEPRLVPGLTAPEGRSFTWGPGEREKWAKFRPFGSFPEDAWEQTVQSYQDKPADQYPPSTAGMFALAPEELVRPLLPAWRPKYAGSYFFRRLMPVVARFESDARDPVLHSAKLNAAEASAALMPFLDAEIAVLMADWLFRLKSVQGVATAWLGRHGLAVVPFLVPDALGKSRPARKKALAALFLIAGEHGKGAVAGAASVHGDEAAAALAEALSGEAPVTTVTKPPSDAPPKPPKLPWLDRSALPRPVLRDGGLAVPLDSAGHIVSLMALSAGGPHEGLQEVFDACTPDSLAAFSLAIFEQWLAAGEPSRNHWVIVQLGWLGDDATVRRVTPVIRAWPGRNGHAKAVQGLGVLTAIGTDVALMQLNGIAENVPFAALGEAAGIAVADAARARGLTSEQLADRLVPDFGLDAEGGMTLDYGPRRFRVGFDEQLKPYVRDGTGKIRKALPKPGVKDDPELAPAAYKRFTALRKDVRTIAADQVRRLERAMVTGRRWTPEEFRTFFAGHPLMWHIARRLVWSASGHAFRIAEDRTLADVEDAAFEPPEASTIGIAHPLHLGGEAKAWSEVFADYEITQPFAQLGRPVHALTEQEAAGDRLARFEGVTVPAGKVLGLTRHGWERGDPQDNGVAHDIWLELTDEQWIRIVLDPGIAVGAPEVFPEQTLRNVLLRSDSFAHASKPNSVIFGGLDPVIASEILAVLTDLTTN
ncbi:DUF4132 domain-containing protein [Actinomadura sp. 9N407]|uniref:DUF4132 domain-containing protein n=1 Tax=Actinomadura sp. 9N407 TaxID=3375154 RepID=UPI0037A3F91E